MGTTDLDASTAGTWKLGDRTVNRIGLGAMRLTGTEAFDLGDRRDRDTSISVLRRAVELGVNHIDTAAFYFSSWLSANQLIHAALAPYDDDLTVVAKVGPARDASVAGWPGRRRSNCAAGRAEPSRARTRPPRRRELPPHRSTTPVTGHVEAMADLVTAGLVRHVGVSNVTLEQVHEAQSVTDVVCVQNRYAVGYGAEGARDRRSLREAGDCGRPVFRYRGRGTGDPAHLEDNVAADSLRLTSDEVDRLDALG